MSQDREIVVNTIADLSENLELFYQQKNQEALLQFDGMIAKLLSVVDILHAYKENHADFEWDEEKVKQILVEAMEAMQEKDLILLADIMQYDFIEYMEELVKGMTD